MNTVIGWEQLSHVENYHLRFMMFTKDIGIGLHTQVYYIPQWVPTLVLPLPFFAFIFIFLNLFPKSKLKS